MLLLLAMISPPYRGPYSASKYALEALSDAMRYQLKESNIHVSIIQPGPIQSNFIMSAIRAFKENIDIEKSHHRALYSAKLDQMEAGGHRRFKLPPERVLQRLIHAAEQKRPKLRYMVTPPTYFLAFARRMLPTVILDMLASKAQEKIDVRAVCSSCCRPKINQ